MNGVINIYKPSGITSFDVVRYIRKVAKTKKVGHTGTLDPLACGVLPVCIGKSTKIVDYIMSGNKVYKARMKLGVVTDTYDKEGKIIQTSEVKLSKNEDVDVINSFKGEISQIPPMYSALKINGQKLYDLARQGIEVERKPRNITIHDIEILDVNLPYVEFEVTCSKGTYIRSLCYDIGDKLCCGATMWALERVGSGSFKKSNSVLLDNLNEENIAESLVSIEDALDCYEKINVTDKCKKLLINGVKVKDKSLLVGINKKILYRVYSDSNDFLGLAIRDDDGLKMEKLLL